MDAWCPWQGSGFSKFSFATKNSASHKRQAERFHRSEVFRGSRPKLHTTRHPPTCLDLLCTPERVVSYDESYGHSQPKHHVAPVMGFKFMPFKDAVMRTLDPCRVKPWKPSFWPQTPKADLIFCANVHGTRFLQHWIHMMHEMMIPNQPPKFNFKKRTWNCLF